MSSYSFELSYRHPFSADTSMPFETAEWKVPLFNMVLMIAYLCCVGFVNNHLQALIKRKQTPWGSLYCYLPYVFVVFA